MNKAGRWVTATMAAAIAGLSLSAMAQQPVDPHAPKKPTTQSQPSRGPVGQPQRGGPAVGTQQFRGPATVQGGQQFRGPAGAAQTQQFRGPAAAGQFHAAHTVGQRGYSFRGGVQGRRVVASFNPGERAAWVGGRWHHEQRFGRYGYWWEVNGVWYFYDQPMDGPPDYVSEVEYGDESLDPNGGPDVVGGPMPPPAVYAPPPYYPPPYYPPPPPPVVCVGPLCIR